MLSCSMNGGNSIMNINKAIEKFSNIVYKSDFWNVRYMNKKNIKFLKDNTIYDSKNSCQLYTFQFDEYYGFVTTKIGIGINNKVVLRGCSCRIFSYRQSCSHVAAALVYYYDDLCKITHINEDDFYDNFINKYCESEKKLIKKEVDVELRINTPDEYDYYKKWGVKLALGTKRLYVMNNHFNDFKDAYETGEGEVKFGKEFIYNPQEHYFSKENVHLIEAYLKYMAESRYDSDEAIKNLFKELKNNQFVLDSYKIDSIYEMFPLRTNLSKINDKYIINFDNNNLQVLFNDLSYILYQGKLYHLNRKEQLLLEDILNNELTKIEVKKDNFNNFTKGIFPYLRKNMDIDGSVDDIVLPKNIKTEIYFDIMYNKINAQPKFIYDQEEVNYFDTSSLVLRDMDYETKVINDLLSYNFLIENNSIVLTDLDKQVEFLENGLEELNNKYVIYTSEKLKNTIIKRKSNINSMFGIGKDNILSYTFELDNINSDELVNIFKDMRARKKYYRLKNGDILSLEDDSLQELNNLVEDLELTDEEIIAGKGEILKYRAIYLDSLKKTKYDIITTDNLFDNFIKNFYEYKDSELTLSKKELEVLRNYQIIGVKWLYNLNKTGFGGILADEMGLGKTIQVIYYLKQILKEDKNAKFLIVVPTSLAYNWDHEFNMYAPEIKKDICVGIKSKRENILKNSKANVIITTYGILREDEALYEDKYFHTVIIDEAQNIKNYHAGISKCVKKIKANTKFALTGTPLENSILELWSIFDFVMPGYLATLTKFQTKYKIKDFDEDSEKLIEGLNKQINPFILRRKKQEVTKELPEKLINDIYIDLGDDQKKIYVAELEKVKKEIDEILKSGGENQIQFKILTLLMRLRQICIDPKIVYENYDSNSNKLDTLDNIVHEYTENNHKILIFSSFLTALNIVKERLNKMKIKTYMIDGSVKSEKRMEMVNDFNNNDDVKVFLIMLKSGGTGLNLTSADAVIHLDLWWNPQAENQATDRAHRIGQTKVVEVIHLVMKGTIEERILELQNKKRLLSDKIIDGTSRTKNLINTLTEEDIKNLLAYENKE